MTTIHLSELGGTPVFSAENTKYQNEETESSTHGRRYLTYLRLPHKTSSTLVEAVRGQLESRGLRLRIGGCDSTLDMPRERVPSGPGSLLGQRRPIAL